MQQIIMLMLTIGVLVCLNKFFGSDDKPKPTPTIYSFEQLRFLKNTIIYPTLEGEIQSVELNPSDDKSLCYQNGNMIYCMEIIRTSDSETLQKEVAVNGDYLKGKLQEALNQKRMLDQVPPLEVKAIGVENGRFIIALELI